MTLFHLTATKDVPEHQECYHRGSVVHQRVAGVHLSLNSLCSLKKKCSSCCVEENESVCLFPPGPQTSARAEISEEMRGGSDHHRSVLARHPGTDIKEWGVCCTLMASAGEACSWTLVSIASNSLVFYCSLCSCLKAPQYCKTAVL